MFPILWVSVIQTDPFRIDPDYRGSLHRRLSWPELGLPWEQRVKVLRAVTALSPRERERERVAGESAKSQHSPRRLVPSVFWNRQCSFEPVPMEAGLSPRSWNFYKLSVREQEERFAKAVCSFSTLLRPAWDFSTVIHACFFLIWFVLNSKLVKKTYGNDLERLRGERKDSKYM